MSSPPWTISVTSYNLLADAYIKPEYYPLVAPEDFLPANRHPRIDARVAALDTDAICTQETDYATFVRLEALLRPKGYRGRWAHRPGGKTDGCATFVRAPWRIHTSMVIDFDDGPRKPSNRIALVTVLANGLHLCAVANVHFEWGDTDKSDAEHHGLHQARRLLVQQQGQDRTIILGDFNAKRGSALLKSFEDYGFVDAHGPEGATFISQGQPVKIDFLMGSYDLKATAVPPTPLTQGTPLPSPTEPSDHVPIIAEFSPA
jgi:endonuclease/exonuclease/phosphatase family metal-dependent hydrolase